MMSGGWFGVGSGEEGRRVGWGQGASKGCQETVSKGKMSSGQE